MRFRGSSTSHRGESMRAGSGGARQPLCGLGEPLGGKGTQPHHEGARQPREVSLLPRDRAAARPAAASPLPAPLPLHRAAAAEPPGAPRHCAGAFLCCFHFAAGRVRNLFSIPRQHRAGRSPRCLEPPWDTGTVLKTCWRFPCSAGPRSLAGNPAFLCAASTKACPGISVRWSLRLSASSPSSAPLHPLSVSILSPPDSCAPGWDRRCCPVSPRWVAARLRHPPLLRTRPYPCRAPALRLLPASLEEPRARR